MNTLAIVTCDACKQIFELSAEVEHTPEGELQFFVCPHCQHRYDYALITFAGVQLRSQMQAIKHQLKHSSDPRLQKRYNDMLSLYQTEVTSRLPVA